MEKFGYINLSEETLKKVKEFNSVKKYLDSNGKQLDIGDHVVYMSPKRTKDGYIEKFSGKPTRRPVYVKFTDGSSSYYSTKSLSLISKAVQP